MKTSMINIVDFMDGFREALDKGDDVLYIGMSGGISGAARGVHCRNGTSEDEYPDRKNCCDRYVCGISRRGTARYQSGKKMLAAGVELKKE